MHFILYQDIEVLHPTRLQLYIEAILQFHFFYYHGIRHSTRPQRVFNISKDVRKETVEVGEIGEKNTITYSLRHHLHIPFHYPPMLQAYMSC